MASIVQRGKSYCVVYYTVKDGVRKQKWETYHSQNEALFRMRVSVKANGGLSAAR